jgi:cysteine desulfurase family protein (TIGR01976 family)
MAYDVAALRLHFPSLASGIAHFDGPGGTQTPREVGEAIAATITGPLSNRGRAVISERNADDAVIAFRRAFGDFLGVDPRGVVYGRSATQIVYDFARSLAKRWGPGDEVIVSRLDHDSNIRPWIQVANAVGASARWLDFDPQTGEVDMAALDAMLGSQTRVIAITGASNLIGTKPAVRAISDWAHAVGALVWVDGVHHAAHEFVDVNALGADFYVCSPYKFLGPHCAVLAASPELLETVVPDKLLPATNDVPERFEFGTLPYEMMAGATAAVDFIAAIAPGGAPTRREQLRASYAAIHRHETRLRERIEGGIAELGEWYEMHSRAGDRTPTLLATVAGGRSSRASHFLATQDVQAPAGSFYAYEAFLHLGTADTHGLRMGLAPYNDDTDVDRLIAGLRAFVGA